MSPYIVTPFLELQPGTKEEDFNIKHKHTRCLIERVFEELKGKWRCLKKERTMYYSPEKAARFFKCCVILHHALMLRRCMFVISMYCFFFLFFVKTYFKTVLRDPVYENFIVPEEDPEDQDDVNDILLNINHLGNEEQIEGHRLRDTIVQTFCYEV